MPEQPNEEERQEVAEAKPDNDAGAIKTSLAAICAVVAFACSLVGTWAAATGHYSTLIAVVVGGIMSFALAKWLGWPPKQIRRRTTDLLNKMATVLLRSSKPPPPDGSSIPPNKPSEAEIIQAECDRLARENVRLRLARERDLEAKEPASFNTTKLQHDNSVDETPTKKLTEEPPPDAAQPREEAVSKPPTPPVQRHVRQDAGNIPLTFSAGPPRWAEYTQDMFDGVIWRWHYKLEFDDTPRDPKPYCAECGSRLSVQTRNHSPTFGRRVWLHCEIHPQPHSASVGFSGDYRKIKRQIQEKITNGKWEEVVARQRAARGW